MAIPRLLPIVCVAIGGVLAMKAVTSLDVVPDVFHAAQAFAADAKTPAKKAAAKKPAARGGAEADKSDDPSESYAVDPALLAADAGASASDAAAIAPAPICATSLDQLAKDAGMPVSELQVLQSLAQRRTQLDQREAQLNSRGQLIDAADAKLDARIQQLSDLKTQIQVLLDQANKVGDDDTNRLVAVYSAMKPKDAAAVMASMSDEVRLPIAAKMKDRALAAILGAMQPEQAKDLTEKLATRMQRTDSIQQQLNKVASGGAAAATPANAPAQAAAKPAAAPAKSK